MQLDKTDCRQRLQKIGLALWCALWPLLLWAIIDPIKNKALRCLIVGGTLALLIGLFVLWKGKWTRALAVALAVMIALILVLPGQPVDARNCGRATWWL